MDPIFFRLGVGRCFFLPSGHAPTARAPAANKATPDAVTAAAAAAVAEGQEIHQKLSARALGRERAVTRASTSQKSRSPESPVFDACTRERHRRGDRGTVYAEPTRKRITHSAGKRALEAHIVGEVEKLGLHPHLARGDVAQAIHMSWRGR